MKVGRLLRPGRWRSDRRYFTRAWVFVYLSFDLAGLLPTDSKLRKVEQKSEPVFSKSFGFRTLFLERSESLFWRQSSTSRRCKTSSPIDFWVADQNCCGLAESNYQKEADTTLAVTASTATSKVSSSCAFIGQWLLSKDPRPANVPYPNDMEYPNPVPCPHHLLVQAVNTHKT